VISDVLDEAKTKMNKAVEVAKDDFGTVRTGRANPALFQKIAVDYYGTPTPLAQLASMQNPEARTLLVTPYDKSALKEIEKAIVNWPNFSCTVIFEISELTLLLIDRIFTLRPPARTVRATVDPVDSTPVNSIAATTSTATPTPNPNRRRGCAHTTWATRSAMTSPLLTVTGADEMPAGARLPVGSGSKTNRSNRASYARA